jgi:hypothetical protein
MSIDMNSNTGVMNVSDFVFFKSGGSIQSGGYSVNSLFLDKGISPFATLNQSAGDQSSSSFADMFKDLAVPSWILSSTPKQIGGGSYIYGDDIMNVNIIDGGAVDDDLHDKLLNLVSGEKIVRRKKTRKGIHKVKNGVTKKNRA